MTIDVDHAAVLRRHTHYGPDTDGDPTLRAAIERAIELLEAPRLIEVPDWRADADRLADALDHLMDYSGRWWAPAVDALIAHEKLVEASA